MTLSRPIRSLLASSVGVFGQVSTMISSVMDSLCGDFDFNGLQRFEMAEAGKQHLD
jgi:hypothetical protein